MHLRRNLLCDFHRGFVPADCAAVCADAATACVAEAVSSAEAAVAAGTLTPEAAEDQLLSAQLRVTADHFHDALASATPCALRHLSPDIPRWVCVRSFLERSLCRLLL